MRQIKLTEDKLNYVDGFEGYIFFDTFSEGKAFKLKIWGVTILSDLGIFDKDVYVPAVSELVFEDVAYIYMIFGVYTNEQCNEFMRNMKGESTSLKLELGDKNNLSDYQEYIFGGTLGRNIGNGELKIYYKGEVTLTYDETVLVDVREFCLNSHKYKF